MKAELGVGVRGRGLETAPWRRPVPQERHSQQHFLFIYFFVSTVLTQLRRLIEAHWRHVWIFKLNKKKKGGKKTSRMLLFLSKGPEENTVEETVLTTLALTHDWGKKNSTTKENRKTKNRLFYHLSLLTFAAHNNQKFKGSYLEANACDLCKLLTTSQR